MPKKRMRFPLPRCPNEDATNFIFRSRHSKPGAFVAQIAAMKTAFARGRIVDVSATAVSGQTVSSPKEASERWSRHIVPTARPNGRR